MTVISPDAGALRDAKEHQRPFVGGGQKYADLLTLNTDAQIALKGLLHAICSTDTISRPHLEGDFQNSLNDIASNYIDGLQPGIREPLRRGRDINLHDTIVDRVTPTLPTTPEVTKEIHALMKHAPQHQDPAIAREIGRNLMGLYATRVLEEAVLIRSEEVSLLEDGKTTTTLPIQTKHAHYVLEEMKRYGIEDVRLYYTAANLLHHANTPTEVQKIRSKIERNVDNREIRALLITLADTYTAKMAAAVPGSEPREPGPPTKSEVADHFLDDLRETYAYIDSLTPEERKGFLTQLPLKTLELLHRTRSLMNVFTDRIATSSELRDMFWQIRLGRKVGDFLKNHPLHYAKPADLHRYTEHLYDKLLRSEGAGFEIKDVLPVEAAGLGADAAVTALVRALTESDASHFPHETSKPVLFTVIVNDFTSIKLHVPQGATEQQIRALVSKARREKIALSPEDRVELTYTGYQPTRERWKNTQYRHLYGHGADGKTPGDYLLHVSTTSSPDRMDPLSLYHVGPHKAAVGLHVGENPQLSILFNHADYDGMPAKKTYRDLKTRILSHAAEEAALGEQSGNHQYLTLQNILNEGEKSPTYPIPEGVGTHIDNFPYQKVTIDGADGKPVVLSPTDVRAITIGLANNIDFMHHLFSGELPPEYAKTHPTHNNIQPNIIGFEALRRSLDSTDFSTHPAAPSLKSAIQAFLGKRKPAPDISTWASDFTASSKRCKQGKGPASTMSAVVGTWEGPLGTVAALMHPGTVTLTDSNGMFSAVIDTKGSGDAAEFSTAQSDSYSPKASRINLRKPRPSVGVIGYNQEGKNGKAITTCRKFPGQAQVEFRRAVLSWFPENEQNSAAAGKTLDYMTELIREWDKLAHGKISLASYTDFQGRIFDFIRSDDACGTERLRRVGIDSAPKMQEYLNDALRQAAQDTLNKEKLEAAHNAFVKAVQEAPQTTP